MAISGRGDTGEEKETQRVEAFSDGVFAIAVTLLILEIRAPVQHDIGSDGALWHALRDLWPAYLAYIISFATILVTWINHHAIMRLVGRTDHTFLLLNGLLLALITAVNFPTSLVAEYIGHAGERAAGLTYSGIFLLMAFAFNIVWRYITWDGHLLLASADPEQIRAIDRRFRFGPLYYVAAFALAFISARASLIFCLLLAVLFALPYTGRVASSR
jgi:uncharacterized membrane protein